MPHVITQACCNDASCVSVCPVDCIHPTPDEAAFMTSEMLFIDPATCIDCGACADACPVDAVRVDFELTAAEKPYAALNEAYYLQNTIEVGAQCVRPASRRNDDFSGLRVAIVGTGPAACYAAAEVAKHNGAEVDMYDRLLTPYGLVRSGVAPDHPGTKAITDVFRAAVSQPNVRLHLGIEIGRDLSHTDLLENHSAVLYAVGAAGDRRLDIPGEDLPGSHAATEFVSWYNGHPDFADLKFDLSADRAVIIGNGNVALDVARILVTDPDTLGRTDMADHALEVLRHSNIREVVILGRRGPAQAAYTNAELLALLHLPGVDVLIPDDEAVLDPTTRNLIESSSTSASVRIKAKLAAEIAARPLNGAAKRIVLRYLRSPTEIFGAGTASGVRVARNSLVYNEDGSVRAVTVSEADETIKCGIVLRAIGYRGSCVPAVPFDEARGVIPNEKGRVVEHVGGNVVDGVYTVGWIKRGPTGVIGSNRKCSTETVGALLDDFAARRLTRFADRGGLEKLIAERAARAVGLDGWNRIDTAEQRAGAEGGRPRRKFVSLEAMLNTLDESA